MFTAFIVYFHLFVSSLIICANATFWGKVYLRDKVSCVKWDIKLLTPVLSVSVGCTNLRKFCHLQKNKTARESVLYSLSDLLYWIGFSLNTYMWIRGCSYKKFTQIRRRLQSERSQQHNGVLRWNTVRPYWLDILLTDLIILGH